MRYRNSEMKIDQLVGYLNDEKINLSPAFQRGHVWRLTTRRKLVKNIVLGKPIPAIFLYKEAVGSRYSYNILDGKQRLESLILFIAATRDDLSIPNWRRYFFGPLIKKHASFRVDLPEGRRAFAKLSDEQVREFGEYSIPTIEITLEDDTALDEVITLFVDINQQGEPVKRFDIVKAMYRTDPILRGVFKLLAQQQRRGQDIFYKAKKSAYSDVLKRLQIIENVAAPNAKVDKMWEKLLEFAIFVRTNQHRSSTAVLKEFIAVKKDARQPPLTGDELGKLEAVFSFLRELLPRLGTTRPFVDQTHSYTMITSILRADLITMYGKDKLEAKLAVFANLLEKTRTKDRRLNVLIRRYLEESEKQTTHVSRRENRDRLFVQIIDAL
jgi:hypothetical protein